MENLSFTRVAGSLTVLGVLSYAICVAWHALVPSAFSGEFLQSALPGFDWTLGGVLIGLVLVIVYSLYAAAVYVSAYNLLGRSRSTGWARWRHVTR
ncbi:MAG: hypothetical protein AB7V44_13280 [Pseudonocardia sp.]